ncbi:phage exclusion lipoprotein Cor, partial [Klebsiella pneumoniae]
MKRFILALGISSVLSGCAGLLDKQDPICSGVAMVGGQETTV